MKNSANSAGKVPLSSEMNFVDFALAQEPKADTPLSEEPLVYYCKDCEEYTEVKKKEKPLKFICQRCKKKNVVIGAKKSLDNFYHLKK